MQKFQYLADKENNLLYETATGVDSALLAVSEREQSLFRINWINVWSWIVCVKFTPVTRLSNQMYPVMANKYPGMAVGK